MCSSETAAYERPHGFSLIELLVGLALAMMLAASVAPLWLSIQGVGSREADRTVGALQGRVAISRFERDLRLAGAYACLFAASGPVLEATPSQVVLLEGGGADCSPTLVEWELVKGSLMRRWGICPEQRPLSYVHSRYSDNKTILQNVGGGSSLAYIVDGRLVAGPVTEADLPLVESVVLTLRLSKNGAGSSESMSTTASVGR